MRQWQEPFKRRMWNGPAERKNAGVDAVVFAVAVVFKGQRASCERMTSITHVIYFYKIVSSVRVGSSLSLEPRIQFGTQKVLSKCVELINITGKVTLWIYIKLIL